MVTVVRVSVQSSVTVKHFELRGEEQVEFLQNLIADERTTHAAEIDARDKRIAELETVKAQPRTPSQHLIDIFAELGTYADFAGRPYCPLAHAAEVLIPVVAPLLAGKEA
jgi:hypothetical protein